MTIEHIEAIADRASRWPGVETAPHRYGGIEFRLLGRKIGHVHDVGLLDLPVSRAVRNQLLTEGRADRHHVLPTSSWITFYVRDFADVRDGLWVLRLSYLDALGAIRNRDSDAVLEVDVGWEFDRLSLSPELARAISVT
ncbi:MAG: luciferase family protein [Halobacteriota archaeon]